MPPKCSGDPRGCQAATVPGYYLPACCNRQASLQPIMPLAAKGRLLLPVLRPVLFPQIGASQHLFGAFHGELADVPSHDMGDFAHALLWPQFVDDGYSALVEDLLVDIVVGIGEGSDLRQVRHTNNLVILREHPELAADD